MSTAVVNESPATPAPAATGTAGESAERDPLGIGFWIAAAWVGVVAFCAAFASWLPTPDPDEFSINRFSFISKANWLGTDSRGRDLFARAAAGARISMLIGIATLLAGWLVGGTLGLMAGYLRGRFDAVVQYFLNLVLAFPAILLALLIVTVRGSSVGTVVFALALLAVPAIARIVRATTIGFADREFVIAARSLGAKPRRVILRELLPNVLPAMLTYGLVQFAVVIIAEGALTYTGNGIPPGTPSWGRWSWPVSPTSRRTRTSR